MKIRNAVIVGLCSALTLSALGSGIEASIPFAFRAGDRELPAGEYSFACTERPDAVVIKGAGKEVRVPIKTRLRGPTGTLDFEGTLAFDRKGEVRTLSEVWIPNEEGVQVGAVEGAHAHLIVHVVPRPDEKMSGQKVFQQTCQVCHGANGQGNEKADKFFGRALPHLNSAEIQAKSDDELREIITHGRRAMDPVRLQEPNGARHSLPTYAVDPLIAYVRTLAHTP